ncbi:hypothetical protein EUTSA_v10023891mg [Eutrema salsugineum]|uniref:F-box domain-containing protein n=1 Tax=Eutrema salsugineum TaxID=72664 RepID=V4JUK5_EUTSA|nr:hypothetical protein EUTSA_v10023891mg [Eutrema salsugineum]
MLSKARNVIRTRHRNKRRKIENESRAKTSETRRDIDEDLVPQDLVIEILRRLPVKSVARFLLVSKLWATIIRSREFIRSFPFQRSLIQPYRLLLAFKDLDNQNLRQIWNFFSSSSTSERLSYLSLTACSNITSPYSRVNDVLHYVNGLINLGCGRQQIICNPSTGKSTTLPKVRTRRNFIRSFLGSDPLDAQYNVLCMSQKMYGKWRSQSFEHQVFTLGGVDKSWRMIECNILHGPVTNGLCIDGVVYYGALTGMSKNECCLVRFNVRSEKFGQVVGFLGDHDTPPSLFSHISLIRYKGKVTLAIQIGITRFELWALEDAEKHEWSKVCFSVHHLLHPSLRIRGDITHTDEIVFVVNPPGHFYFLYYDHQKNIIVKSREYNSGKELMRRFSLMVPFTDYVESVMLL